MRVTLVPEAEDDLSDAVRWYESKQAGLGEAFVAAVAEGLEAIAESPGRYSRPVGYEGRRDVRRLLLARFPYAIVFEILPDRVRVAAIAHGRRKPGFWEKRID